QTIQSLDGRLGGRAGGARDRVDTGGAGDVDAAMDRSDPGGAGKGHDDSGRAENRQAANNSESTVERALRDPFAAGDGNFDMNVGLAMLQSSLGFNRLADHLARHGIDRWFARGQGQAGARHRADAFAGGKTDAGAL